MLRFLKKLFGNGLVLHVLELGRRDALKMFHEASAKLVKLNSELDKAENDSQEELIRLGKATEEELIHLTNLGMSRKHNNAVIKKIEELLG